MNVNFLDTLCYKNSFVYNKIMNECLNLNDEAGVHKRISELKKYSKQLKKLLTLPKIEQKTDEWYAIRQNLVTASDFAQALGKGKFGTKKQFYQKKCEVASADSSVAGKTNPFFKWGNMFEQVAIDIYTLMFGLKVHNFGLLQHPKYDFFGASPDGISEVGIMVEIKCPRKRKIDGTVPDQYYYQIQGQLDVCNLDECDYFECDFSLYDVEKDYFDNFDEYDYKGIIIETYNDKFEYSDIKMTKIELQEWLLLHKNTSNINISYWYLNNFNIKRIHRDVVFLKENMALLKNVWDNVLFYRQNKEKYNIEVLNELKIETQRYKKKNIFSSQLPIVQLKGWSFIDDPEN